MFFQLLLVLLVLVYAIFKVRLYHAEKVSKNIPGLNTLPIIGDLHYFKFIKSTEGILRRFMRLTVPHAEKGITKLWIGPSLLVAIWNPAYFEAVSTNSNAASKGNLYYLLLGEMANGVFVQSGGQTWKDLRKAMVKSLGKKFLENDYIDVYVKRVNDYADFIKENKMGKNFDIGHDLTRLSLDIFSETHLGININETRDNLWDAQRYMIEFVDYTFLYIAKYHFIFKNIAMKLTGDSVRMKEVCDHLNNFLQWVLDERKKATNDNVGEDEFLTDFLMKREKEKNIPHAEVKKQLADYIAAGAETSSRMMSTAILYLAIHTEYQEKAYQEQYEIFGESSRDPTYEELCKMEYLDRVVKETIRIVCPPGIFKYCEGDVNIGEYTIPRGSIIFLFVKRLHSDPRYWERPDAFYPDHFLPEKEAHRPKFAYVPFGVGQRACPGYKYGTNMVKTILSTLIRRYSFTSPIKYEDIVYKCSITLDAKCGYPVCIKERF